MEQLLGIHSRTTKDYASLELIKAVIVQRSVKAEEEIEKTEIALDITHEMQTTAMKMAKPGVNEKEIAGRMEGIEEITAGE